jgi:hypothetical protein
MGPTVSALAAALGELEDLLRRCGEDDRAGWVALRRERVDSDPAARAEVRRVLAGMGSLGDIPLRPRPGETLTVAEIELRRNDLLDRLDRLTDPEPRPGPPRSIRVGSSNTDLPPR